MSFGTITGPSSTAQPQALAAVNYFVAIDQLSAHNAPQAHEETVISQPSAFDSAFIPYLPYVPYVLSAILFLVVFSFIVVNKVKNVSNIISVLFLAIIVGGIPSILSYVQHGSRQSVNAGPEEVPRVVAVQRFSVDSVRVTWRTDAKEIGVVKLGEAPFQDQTARVYVSDNQQSIQSHTTDITGLKNNVSYEFEILSGHTWYDNGGSYIKFTFKNSP